jgi:hypothetical protein
MILKPRNVMEKWGGRGRGGQCHQPAQQLLYNHKPATISRTTSQCQPQRAQRSHSREEHLSICHAFGRQAAVVVLDQPRDGLQGIARAANQELTRVIHGGVVVLKE